MLPALLTILEPVHPRDLVLEERAAGHVRRHRVAHIDALHVARRLDELTQRLGRRLLAEVLGRGKGSVIGLSIERESFCLCEELGCTRWRTESHRRSRDGLGRREESQFHLLALHGRERTILGAIE